MQIVEQLLYSGGGFFAGVIATITYARATGNQLRWPWHIRNKKNSNGVEPEVR